MEIQTGMHALIECEGVAEVFDTIELVINELLQKDVDRDKLLHFSRDQPLSYDRSAMRRQICHMTEEVSAVIWKMKFWRAFRSGKLVAQLCAILPFQYLIRFLAMS